jgi:hypothetical protein
MLLEMNCATKPKFIQIAKTRLAASFQQSEVFIEGLLESRKKEIAAIKEHVYQVTNQDSTDPQYGHFPPDLARTVAEYATSYFH